MKKVSFGLLLIGAALLGVGGFFAFKAYESGYAQASADLTPLIHPEEGPTKIIPDDHGGLKVPHQNRLVYNLVGPNTPKPKVENLLAEPEKPLENPSPAILPAIPVVVTPPVTETKAPEPSSIPSLEIEHEAPQTSDAFEESLSQTLAAVDDASHKKTTETLEKIKKEEAAPQEKPKAKLIRMQLATAKQSNAPKVLADLRKKLGPALKGIPLNAVPVETEKGTLYKIYAGPFEKTKIPALCQKLSAYGQSCVLPKK